MPDTTTDRRIAIIGLGYVGLPLALAFNEAGLEVIGVDAFKPGEVTLRFRIKTLPLKQGEVGRELRRRIKKAFDASGIRLPVPQMTVTLKK